MHLFQYFDFMDFIVLAVGHYVVFKLNLVFVSPILLLQIQ